jgi:hypothetical protein
VHPDEHVGHPDERVELSSKRALLLDERALRLCALAWLPDERARIRDE